MTSGRASSLRLRQGLALLAGSVVFLLAVGGSADAFYWTPFGIGLVYLAAAAAGGRQGGYWAGAFVFSGWGAAVLIAQLARPDLDIAGLYLAGAGLGAMIAVAAPRAGIRSEPMGAAGAIVVAGAILALAGRWPPLTEARTYALLVGAVGLVNVVWALLAKREPQRPRSADGPGQP